MFRLLVYILWQGKVSFTIGLRSDLLWGWKGFSDCRIADDYSEKFTFSFKNLEAHDPSDLTSVVTFLLLF